MTAQIIDFKTHYDKKNLIGSYYYDHDEHVWVYEETYSGKIIKARSYLELTTILGYDFSDAHNE